MPIDVRRCAEAAAHAALAEAFAPPERQESRQRHRRLGPVRAVLLGAGLVTGARVALDPDLRRAMLQAVARRFPLEELLDELVLEADVVPDEDDGASGATDRAQDAPDGSENEHEHEHEHEPEVERDVGAGDVGDGDADERSAELEREDAEGGPTRAGAQQRRGHAKRTRGAANGQGRRKPPSRGSRA